MKSIRYTSLNLEKKLLDFVIDYDQDERLETNCALNKTQIFSSKNNIDQKSKNIKNINGKKLPVTNFFSVQSSPMTSSIPDNNKKVQPRQIVLTKPKMFQETSRMSKSTPKDEIEGVTKFIKNVYQKYNGLGTQQVLSEFQNKKYINPKSEDYKTFINPKQLNEQRKKLKCSQAKKSFLYHYNSFFLVDGKIQLSDNKRAVDNIIFSQLSASALSSHNWRSVLSKRRSLYSKSQALELDEYPLDSNYSKKTRCHTAQKQKIFFPDYKIKNDVFIEEFQKQQLKDFKVYGSQKCEYSDILNYMDHIKGGSLSKSLEQANDEVSYIKERAKRQNKPQKQIYSYRPPSRERCEQEEIFSVQPNKLINTNIILLQQQKPDNSQRYSEYYNDY